MKFTKLTDAQRQDFDRDGYLVVPNVLERPSIDRLIAAGDRLVASDQVANRLKLSDGYDGFRNCVAMDDAFIELLTHPKVVPLVVQLMSPNLSLLTSHLIYKHSDPAGTPPTRREPGWHRDILMTPYDLGQANIPLLDIKIAYYLTDLSRPNSGATLFAPGSHKLKERLVIPEGQVDPEGCYEPLVKAGDCVLFENRTWHAAATNLSGYTRKAVMFGYTYQWMRPSDYVVQPDSLLEKLDDIGKQLLGGLRRPDEKFSPGLNYEPLKKWWYANDLPKYGPKE